MAKEPPRQHARQASWADKIVDFYGQHAAPWVLGLWVAAITCLCLYAHGKMRHEPDAFIQVECWVLGLGCIGLPIAPMRLFGRSLTPAMCVVASVLLFADCAAFSGLVSTNQLNISPVVSTFGLVMPEALGIHAANAAIILGRERRAVKNARAHQRTAFDARISDYARQIAEMNEQREQERSQLKQDLDRTAVERAVYESKVLELGTWHREETARLEAAQRKAAVHAREVDELRARHEEEVSRLQHERNEDVEAAYICGIIKAAEHGERRADAVNALVTGPRQNLQEAADKLVAELAKRDGGERPEPVAGTPLRLVASDGDEVRQGRASGH